MCRIRAVCYICIMMKGKQRRERPQKQVVCQVCHLKNFEGEALASITCSSCSATCHRNCYHPQFEEKGKTKFKCDECKYTAKVKEAKLNCSVCGGDKENGMLKNVGSEEWMHVLCALSSLRTKLGSYRTLAFIVEGSLPRKQVKKGNRCVNCNYDQCPGLSCRINGCTNYSHLNCIILPKFNQQTDSYSAFLTPGLLDKHEDSLITHLRMNPPKETPFKGLTFYYKPLRQLRYFVCSQHNGDQFFIWCHCGGQGSIDSIQCERCSRWYHKECSSSQSLCSGCVNNNIYAKNVTLPQLIGKAAEVQESGSLDKQHIKFLDHFSLKLSQNMGKLIAKSSFQVERYYLRKILDQTNASDTWAVDRAVEMIYYLVKREIKDKDSISPAELEEIVQTFNKNNKFEWNKQSKVEKRFKDNLENLLKAIRKDGTRQIKSKLSEFIKRNQSPTRSHKEIASDLSQLIKMLQTSQGWKQAYSNFPVKDAQRHLIEFFYQMKFSPQDMNSILSAIRTIYNPRAKNTIIQSQYEAIAPIFQRTLSDQKRKIFQSVFDNLMRDLTIRKTYKEKQNIKNQLQAKVKTSKNGKERQTIKASILSHRLLITSASPLMQIEKDAIEVSILKRKLRKVQDPSPNELPQTKRLIKKLLEIDSKSQSLTDEERKEFQQWQLRLQFYQNICGYARESISQGAPSSESMQDERSQSKEGIAQRGRKIERPNRCHSLREKASAAIMQWKLQENDAIVVSLSEMNKLATKQVQFDQKQWEMVSLFGQNLVEYFSKSIENREITSTGHLLQKLNRIVIYCKCQANFPIIARLYSLFHTWKQDLDNFDDIAIALETHKQTERLLEIVEEKLEEADEVGLDLSSEIRKLKVVKLWGQLSLKLQAGHKTTIASIQTTRSLMDRISYPRNCIRRRVEALQAQSKVLNKRISLFLEKPKLGELEVYEELKAMSGKMSVADGIELQHDLQRSDLDVEVELQELIEEIKEYKAFPKNIWNHVDSIDDVDKLQAVRRKFLDNSFRLQGEGLQHYHRLLIKITQLKCQQYELTTPITKKQYFKFINSGTTGAQLYSQTINLHRGYKQVEKAEKQMLSLKPKFQNLLPCDCRRVRDDLQGDPTQLGKVTRWLTASDKAKDRYRHLRNTRADFVHLAGIQSQLLRIPINNKDILQDVSNIRRQLDDLSNKARIFLQSSDSTVQFESPYVADIVNRYRILGTKNDYLDKFEGIFNRNRSIIEFAKFPSADSYANFRKLCQDTPQLIHNDQVYRAREAAFYRLSQLYLQSPDPMVQVGYTLLGEGGFLMKYPAKVGAVMPRLLQINVKFNKWQQTVPRMEDRAQAGSNEEEEVSQEGLQDDDEDDIDESQLDDEEIDGEGIDDEDSYIQDDSSSSHRNQNRKRPRPANQIVELDDD